MIVGQHRAHALVGFEHRRRDDLRPDFREVDEPRRIPVEEHAHVAGNSEARRPSCAALIERGRDGDRGRGGGDRRPADAGAADAGAGAAGRGRTRV